MKKNLHYEKERKRYHWLRVENEKKGEQRTRSKYQLKKHKEIL